jgi:multicomponent K+:H+ antiporter subunit E
MSEPTLNNSPHTHKRQWFPHPALSVFMLILWLLLVNEISGGHIVLGSILAWAIPYVTQQFWPESMTMRKPWVAVKFVLTVLWDIVVANMVLAVLILGPGRKLQPAFMVLPLDIEQEFTITLLASTISLTPGTVSADLNMTGRYLIIHSLHVTDVEAAIADIKQRYEAPLKEIFECSNS